MRLSIIQSRRGRFIISVGMSATVLFGFLFLLLVYSATSMSPDDAEKRVRLCMQRDLSQRHMNMLRDKGLAVPDNDMARQWKDEIEQSRNLNFVSVKVRRPFLDILFSETPTYVAQVIVGDENRTYRTHYFWLSWDGVDREISRFAWFVSI